MTRESDIFDCNYRVMASISEKKVVIDLLDAAGKAVATLRLKPGAADSMVDDLRHALSALKAAAR